MNWPIFFAILSPALFGLMNVLDAWIVKRKVRYILGFSAVSGLVNLLLGVTLALLLSWEGYSFIDLRFSILAGAMLGIQVYVYYKIMARHDASHFVGLIYIYPVMVAILSYLFLGEHLSAVEYFGVLVTLCGVLTLSLRMKKLKFTIAFWSIGIAAITSALNEFFIKISVVQIPEWHGAAINSIIMGLFIMAAILNTSIRKGFYKELKNIPFVVVSESLVILAIVTLYLAMSGLSATIVSAISATQPLFVLVFEMLAGLLGIQIVQDIEWRGKIFSISLIVLGIVIMI
jgi:bacterial/archaeal transporter family protein